MRTLTPPFILEKLADGQTAGSLQAVVLFVDTSGFTPLTTQLMQHGKEGAEIIAQLLAEIFAPLIELVYERGGFVAGFAGDAFKAIFPAELPDVCQRAMDCAWQIHQRMAHIPAQETRFGSFYFAVKVCMAAGMVDWTIWIGDESRFDGNHSDDTHSDDTHSDENKTIAQSATAIFAGDALDRCIAMDPFSTAGEVVMSQEIYHRLSAEEIAAEPVDRYYRLSVWSGSSDFTISKERATQSASYPSALPAQPLVKKIAYSQHAWRFFMPQLLHSQVQGEFRQVTTVFINLQHLPTGEAAHSFQRQLFTLLAQYGGYLCRIGQIGDLDRGGTLLLFWGAPTTHENDVSRALGFVQDFKSISPSLIRVGVTTSLAYAGFVGAPHRQEYTCYGLHVNLAARQMVNARWGEVLLDETSARRASLDFETKAHGEQLFKGFSALQPIYLLVQRRAGNKPETYQSAYVGRQSELKQLRHAIQPIFAGRFAGMITIEGEAGMGKSRLVHEFQQMLKREHEAQRKRDRQQQGDKVTRWQGDDSVIESPDHLITLPAWFHCQTDEILRQPLNPFRYWLRHYFNQSSNQSEIDNKTAFTSKLDALLSESNPKSFDIAQKDHGTRNSQFAIRNLSVELDRTRSFLGALIELHWEGSLYAQLEPKLRFENTLDALKTLIKVESLRQPVIIHLEDAHWLDLESQLFVEKLTHNVEEFPFALVMTRRAEETGGQPDQETRKQGEDEIGRRRDGETSGKVIRLVGLGDDVVAGIASGVLDGKVSPALVALLAERAEGNPFFVEQLLLYLRQNQQLTESASGWELGKVDSGAQVQDLLPADVRSLLTARLDQLPQAVKEVVQTASVLGREFDFAVLRRMLDEDSMLAEKMNIADQSGIWSAMSQARYLFRHALLRDAAYEMQLRTQLRILHQRAGTAIEEVYQADLTRYFGELAYHFDQAEISQAATRWYALAGEEASKQYANEAAARYFQRALELTAISDGATRYPLLLGSEAVHNWLGKRPIQQAVLADLATVIDLLADDAKRSEVKLRRAAFHLATGEYSEAASAAQQAVIFAQKAGDALAEARAYHRWGRSFWQAGEYEQAHPYLEMALKLAHDNNGMSEASQCLYDLAVISHYQARFAESNAYLSDATRLYETLGDKRGSVLCSSMRGLTLIEQGAFADALKQFEQALRLSREVGWRYTEARLLIQSANSQFYLGIYLESRRLHEQAIRISTEIGDREGIALSLDTLGLIAENLTQPQQAIAYYQEALDIYRALDDVRGQGFVLTHWGYTLIQQALWQEAGNVFERSLELRRSNANQNQLADTLVGLAYVALKLGKSEQAISYADQVVKSIELQGIPGIEFPVLVYLLCFKIFKELAIAQLAYEETATQTLRAGYDLLIKQANAIQEVELRSSFLKNVWFNRDLYFLAQQEFKDRK